MDEVVDLVDDGFDDDRAVVGLVLVEDLGEGALPGVDDGDLVEAAFVVGCFGFEEFAGQFEQCLEELDALLGGGDTAEAKQFEAFSEGLPDAVRVVAFHAASDAFFKPFQDLQRGRSWLSGLRWIVDEFELLEGFDDFGVHGDRFELVGVDGDAFEVFVDDR